METNTQNTLKLRIEAYGGGILEIYPNKVVIKKKGLAAMASKGANEHEIYIKSITGVNLKLPTWIANGRFEVMQSGQDIRKVRDENVVVFLKKQLPDFQKAKSLIEELVNK